MKVPFNKNRVTKLGIQTYITGKIIHWYEMDGKKYGIVVNFMSLDFINEDFDNLMLKDDYIAVYNGLIAIYLTEKGE